MQPKWSQLLYEQQYGHGITTHGPASGGRVGLTPSFLVGAMRTPPGAVGNPASSRRELSALLESMRDNVSGRRVCIAECSNLQQPIASLTEGTALGHLGDAILRSGGSPSKLYAWPQCFARDSRDVESLVDSLWNILGSSVCEVRFSYRGGTWQKFDEHDLAFIRRAFENDDA
jgi:hypothetical protein